MEPFTKEIKPQVVIMGVKDLFQRKSSHNWSSWVLKTFFKGNPASKGHHGCYEDLFQRKSSLKRSS
ncbi:hypothetical protein CD29_06390 [Ureibacillus manganicus DSM 26584]|uniref:Uncharacterized protein n=1 Tax=Ureibacillus manganicus DSM 26584 TaxID=1384049 RepID=A0A0A3I757_9BACL|nr:hypothetical protein CD29_06390 [Ureibacillus manganicus DSM 26584]